MGRPHTTAVLILCLVSLSYVLGIPRAVPQEEYEVEYGDGSDYADDDQENKGPSNEIEPKEGGEGPKEGDEEPNDGGDEPKEGGEEPSEGGDEPKEGGDEPKDGGAESKDGGEDPKDGGDEPKDGGGEPDGYEEPKEGGEDPSDGGDQGKEGGGEPKEGGDGPGDGGEQPNEGGEGPKEGGDEESKGYTPTTPTPPTFTSWYLPPAQEPRTPDDDEECKPSCTTPFPDDYPYDDKQSTEKKGPTDVPFEILGPWPSYYHPDPEIWSIEEMDKLATHMTELMNSMQLYSSFMKDVLIQANEDKKKQTKPKEGYTDGDEGGDDKNHPPKDDDKDEPPKEGEGDSEGQESKDDGKKEDSGDSDGAEENPEEDKDSEKKKDEKDEKE